MSCFEACFQFVEVDDFVFEDLIDDSSTDFIEVDEIAADERA